MNINEQVIIGPEVLSRNLDLNALILEKFRVCFLGELLHVFEVIQQCLLNKHCLGKTVAFGILLVLFKRLPDQRDQKWGLGLVIKVVNESGNFLWLDPDFELFGVDSVQKSQSALENFNQNFLFDLWVLILSWILIVFVWTGVKLLVLHVVNDYLAKVVDNLGCGLRKLHWHLSQFGALVSIVHGLKGNPHGNS